jgi:hypothetical protein
MKNLIENYLVKHHAKCSVDKYGQKKALDFCQIFEKDSDAIEQYLKENRGILKLVTYGYAYGTYLGISEILDKEIKEKCSIAFNENPNYKWAMSH